MLITVDTFIKQYFSEGSRPSKKSVNTAIKRGKLIGTCIGNTYYVDERAFLAGLEGETPSPVKKNSKDEEQWHCI